MANNCGRISSAYVRKVRGAVSGEVLGQPLLEALHLSSVIIGVLRPLGYVVWLYIMLKRSKVVYQCLGVYHMAKIYQLVYIYLFQICTWAGKVCPFTYLNTHRLTGPSKKVPDKHLC